MLQAGVEKGLHADTALRDDSAGLPVDTQHFCEAPQVDTETAIVLDRAGERVGDGVTPFPSRVLDGRLAGRGRGGAQDGGVPTNPWAEGMRVVLGDRGEGGSTRR